MLDIVQSGAKSPKFNHLLLFIGSNWANLLAACYNTSKGASLSIGTLTVDSLATDGFDADVTGFGSYSLSKQLT